MTDALTCLLAPSILAAPMPPPDPLGYPLPPWILQALSYLTLTLHLLAVNFTVGALFVYIWLRLRGRSGQDGIARFLGSGFPLGVSYIITLGIPPLLFVQVLYGQQIFSSSVLIGAYWIQVVPAMIVAYAGLYYHKMQRGRRPRGQTLVVTVCLLLLLYVGYLIASNLSLSMNPGNWGELYVQSPAGAVLHHADGSIGPRLILFLACSPALAGIALIWRGAFLMKWGRKNQGRESQRLGFRVGLVSIPVGLVAAVGVFFTQREEIAATVSSGLLYIVPLLIGAIAAAATIGFARASVGGSRVQLPLMTTLGLFVMMACLVVFRDMVRVEQLRPYFDMSTVPINAQWTMFGLFMVTFVIGLLVLIVLFARVFPRMAETYRSDCPVESDPAS